VFMVLLRIAIGWHFFYEGAWKIEQGNWTATQYLMASSGPFRDVFRWMVRDVDGLERMTKASIEKRIDERVRVLTKHYGLSNEQQKELAAFAEVKKNGSKDNPGDTVFVAWLFDDAYPGAAEFKKQLDDYRKLLSEIEPLEARKNPTAFEVERLTYMYQKKSQARTALLGLVEGPLKAVDAFVLSRVTPQQLAAGPAPRERSQTAAIDFMNMWALTLVGACLMLGLFTRLACVGAAALLLMYYLAMPPWPGLPPNPESEGHYLYVNKNVIELLAVLMLATSGAGRWAGLDAYISAFLRRRGATPQPATPQPQSEPQGRR